eukprot:CAMPEP_0115048768 /NCGR_PEP_ID=MMETSP0227-20121206/781_1 /TAXON_ID=89957 /ORGANISM="Polarella glacialis, Strain CCMP 1383" /LENGTH=128 /DNA_ID=CAMNT_0002432287 /DNA_START=23 /DNA_END=409 /DNA_ORIENTATION=+
MTAVQNDRAWRQRVVDEVWPLDRPQSIALLPRRSPISQNYGAEFRVSTPAYSTASYSSYGSYSRTSASSSTGGVSRRSGYSSIGSQAVRSSVLSIELEHERELREAVEKEVLLLRAQLAKNRASGTQA